MPNLKDAIKFAGFFAEEVKGSIVEQRLEKHDPNEFVYSEIKAMPRGAQSITPNKAVQIVYYLMASDGEIFHDEEEKYLEVAAEINPLFLYNRNTIEQECKKQVEKAKSSPDYFASLFQSVKQLLDVPIETSEGYVPAELFLWNLFAIAYSDNHCSPEEESIIKYIAYVLDVDRAVFFEYENAINTFAKLDQEQQWLKSVGVDQLSFEDAIKYIDQIEKRKKTILENTKQLIISKGGL